LHVLCELACVPRLEIINGTMYLSCASTHLTAFIAAAGGAISRFSVNTVDPVGDAGQLPVGIPGPTGNHCRFSTRAHLHLGMQP
jgi:hypothetical protein